MRDLRVLESRSLSIKIKTMKQQVPFIFIWNILCLPGIVIGEVTGWPESVCRQSPEENHDECRRAPEKEEENTVLVLNSSSSSSTSSSDDVTSEDSPLSTSAEHKTLIEATATAIEEELMPRQQEPYQCNIYLAPSSIPGAGFGIFTMRDIDEGEKILPYADAPSIPLCDDNANGVEETDWNHVDYLWSGQGLAEYECKSVSESVVTFGALCNFHTYLANVHPLGAIYDDTMSNRFTSPMAGSFSYHGGHAFEATQAIKAGDEIFADYGEKWLDNRHGTFADFVPREDDFRKAASLLNKIHREMFENKVHLTDAIMRTYKAIASTMDPRIGSILPDTASTFKHLTKEQYRSKNRPLKALLAENTIEKRSIEWTKENGICLDLVRPGKSTIPHAGQGAFAQGYITKGSIISPGPLLNIRDRNLMKLYNNDDEVVGEQLLLNYCFSHIKSPLLLCPQTNMILMNHCSSRKPGQGHCGENGPNAKVQWGTSWDPDTSEWLKLSLEEVVERTANQRRGLSLEVIATRDIHPGEEVLIDYGENWENAYDEHLKNWEPPVDDGTYVPVRTMINNKDYRTLEELEKNPYPDNIINVCYFYNGGNDDDEDEDEEDEIVEIEKDGSKYVAEGRIDGEDSVYKCELLEKYMVNDKTVYTVRVLYSDKEHFILTNYPSESISFRMNRYKSDTFLLNAFRHFVEIEDDIFPEQWKVYPLEEDEDGEEEDNEEEVDDEEDEEEE
mmetsp:Transcript_11650/g.21788  ORF Transcript_11650/g.21788 Transcript_11650/m.21788 type:complete len:731 (-) Transcript_11650:289-2481(-)